MKKQFTVLLTLLVSILNAQSYWQQRIAYDMDIDVDVKEYRYHGKQNIQYTNNSPDALDKVYFHLYWNAFQQESMMDYRLQTIVDPDRRMTQNGKSILSTLEKNNEGFQKISKITFNGQDAKFKVHGTVLEVILPQNIEAGTSAEFFMEWDAQVPSSIRRAGKSNKEGIEFSMTQWYPKMAEYDFEGWHLDQYIAREFHGVWGDFNVNIHIDKNYVIGGSGKLMNPNKLKGYGGKPKRRTKKSTWNFKAENIHDFAWAADPDFIVEQQKVPNTDTQLYFVYQPGKKTTENWQKVQPYAVEFFTFMNNKFGKYPWNTYSFVQGGDGGMEYGTTTLITGERKFKSLAGVMFHEAAHSWFQHLFATNETVYEWMDEGFTSYAERSFEYKIFDQPKEKTPNLNPYKGAYDGYYYLVKSKSEEPLSTHADMYHSNRAYGINAYYKGQVLAAQLGYIIGEENLSKTWLKYYDDFKFTHPTPNDFKRVAEKVSGINLKWYFNQFINTTNKVDYAVGEIENGDITIQNKGDFAMPLDVLVTYKDGTAELFYVPLTSMYGEKPAENYEIYKDLKRSVLKSWGWTKPSYKISTNKNVKAVIIDPTQRIADVNYLDNTK